jgi:O-antigen/teichoic acid export membrane protein
LRGELRTSISLLALGYTAAAGANLLPSLLIGRSLGASALGAFALALALARIFFAASDLGGTAQLTRSVSRDPSTAPEALSLWWSFRLLLIPLACAFVFFAGDAAHRDSPGLFAYVSLAQGAVSLQLLYEALFLASGLRREVALLTTCNSAATAVACVAWWRSHGALDWFGIAYLAAAATGLSVWIVAARSRLHIAPRAHLERRALRDGLRSSWPIGISALLAIAALRAPIVVLGTLRSSSEVGMLSAADMFVTAAAIVQTAVTNATYPTLAATFRKDARRFRELFWYSNLALAACGIVIAVGLALFGARCATFLFPSRDFTGLDELLPVVGWSTPALFLVHHNIMIFAAADHERSNLRLMSGWFAVIVTFQLALVPSFGAIGAAWGVLMGRLLGLCGLAVAVRALAIHRGSSTTIA